MARQSSQAIGRWMETLGNLWHDYAFQVELLTQHRHVPLLSSLLELLLQCLLSFHLESCRLCYLMLLPCWVLLIIGEDISSLHDEEFEDLSYPIYKEIVGYGKYMKKYKREQGAISKTKHNAFVFFWLCKFFICSNSIAMVNEYFYYVTTIVFDKPINLGALFLSLFYASLKSGLISWKPRTPKPFQALYGSCFCGLMNTSPSPTEIALL